MVGFKPPFGRVPEEAPYNLDQYCHEGPLARTVADCALLQNVMSGPHPRDLVCVAPKLEIPEVLEGIKGMRIAFVAEPGDYPVDDDVARNTAAAVEAFREAGAVVEEVELPIERAKVLLAASIHFASLMAADIMSLAESHAELMNSYSLSLGERCMADAQRVGFAEGLRLEGEIMAAVGRILEDHELLLLPTVTTRGLIAGEDYDDHGLTVDGLELSHYGESMLTLPFNIASRCPVMSVPSGFGDNGVPTGLQIAGRPYEDVAVFRAAAAYERVRPWLDSPDARPMLVSQAS